MNNCNITLWVEIRTTATLEQRLDEKKIFSSRKDFPRVHPMYTGVHKDVSLAGSRMRHMAYVSLCISLI